MVDVASYPSEILIRDLEAAGLRRVPAARHAMRATFMTLLETCGANPRITGRFTHAAGTDVQKRLQADRCLLARDVRRACQAHAPDGARRPVTVGVTVPRRPPREPQG